MKKRLFLVLLISLVLIGCQQKESSDSFELGEVLFSIDTSQEKIIEKGTKLGTVYLFTIFI